MEGGIAILLLLLLVAGIGPAAVAFTGLGAAFGLSRRAQGKRDQDPEKRPEHKRPSTPYHEHTRFVGAEDEVERSEQR